MLLLLTNITITLTSFFYSIGVLVERISQLLKKWHVVTFWIGFTFGVIGTLAMHYISDNLFDLADPHTLTG